MHVKYVFKLYTAHWLATTEQVCAVSMAGGRARDQGFCFARRIICNGIFVLLYCILCIHTAQHKNIKRIQNTYLYACENERMNERAEMKGNKIHWVAHWIVWTPNSMETENV